MKQTMGYLALVLVAAIAISSFPINAVAASREVMLEDLHANTLQSDLYHRGERPGRVVRVVPWMNEDGGYTLLAITETGWVYQAGEDPASWKLVGRIFDKGRPGHIRPSLD